MIYYIADTHFGDERVMCLAHRPFKTVEEMNEIMINNWNRKVKQNDHVYIVGDVAFSDFDAQSVLCRLNGAKHLIVGNHDSGLSQKVLDMFDSISMIKKIEDNGKSVVLCHYPLLSYENSIYGGYQVFGHIHNNPNDLAYTLQNQLPNSLHAGVDVNCFEPKTLDELIEIKESNR